MMVYLTPKEEEILAYFWQHGALFVKDLLELHDEPKPHYNTLSTIIRTLVDKNYVTYTSFGNTYQYYAKVSAEEYRNGTLESVATKYFDNSYTRIVSSLIEEEKIDIKEIQELIRQIKNK